MNSPIRRVLLVHNSPRVGTYFSRLRAGISSPELIGCRISARVRQSAPPRGTIGEIIDYGMCRKRARAKYGAVRLGIFRGIYTAAARLHYDHAMSMVQRLRPDALGVWGGNAVDAKAVVIAARHCEIPCLHFENGFLPNTTQMDPRGVNVESSVPRDPEFYANRLTSDLPDLPDSIVPRTPHRRKKGLAPISLPDRYIFVPFQVQLDSQILLHSPWIRGMRELFQTMIDAAQRVGGAPPPTLVFKQHPSCPIRYPDLQRQADALSGVYFANGNSTDELLRGASGVVTINSTVGTEGLLLAKPVLTLGNAVYEIPGVASSARSEGQIADWMADTWAGRPPPSPLRESFLRFLIDDYLIPNRHQDPGPTHLQAIRERLLALSGIGRGPEPSADFKRG